MMTNLHPLTGKRILVVEDDYYLASDAKALLEQAGARVVGPFGAGYGEDNLAAETQLDGALIDINLGQGPNFKLADGLSERGVPFIFITGYDAEVIPPAFSNVPRLEKPANARDLISALARAIEVHG